MGSQNLVGNFQGDDGGKRQTPDETEGASGGPGEVAWLKDAIADIAEKVNAVRGEVQGGVREGLREIRDEVRDGRACMNDIKSILDAKGTTAAARGVESDVEVAIGASTSRKSIMLSSGWELMDITSHPSPPYGLSSPVITHLLTTWSGDVNKVGYVRSYLNALTSKDGLSSLALEKLPKKLTIQGLAEDVKTGFVTIVGPMVKGRVEIFGRKGETQWDLAFCRN